MINWLLVDWNLKCNGRSIFASRASFASQRSKQIALHKLSPCTVSNVSKLLGTCQFQQGRSCRVRTMSLDELSSILVQLAHLQTTLEQHHGLALAAEAAVSGTLSNHFQRLGQHKLTFRTFPWHLNLHCMNAASVLFPCSNSESCWQNNFSKICLCL